jgi:hypothetical protein
VIYQAVRARLGESRFHSAIGSALHAGRGGVTAYFFDRNGSHRHTRAATC